MINPGIAALDNAREDVAAANLAVFLDAVGARADALDTEGIKRRVAGLAGEPLRDAAADRDGRYGWNLPLSDGRTIQVLMPGVPLSRVRDDLSAQAPCLRVSGTAWWWNDAVGIVASEGAVLDPRWAPPSGGSPGSPGRRDMAVDARQTVPAGL